MIKFAFIVVSVKDAPRRGVPFNPEWFDTLAKTVKEYWADMSGGRIQVR